MDADKLSAQYSLDHYPVSIFYLAAKGNMNQIILDHLLTRYPHIGEVHLDQTRKAANFLYRQTRRCLGGTLANELAQACGVSEGAILVAAYSLYMRVEDRTLVGVRIL